MGLTLVGWKQKTTWNAVLQLLSAPLRETCPCDIHRNNGVCPRNTGAPDTQCTCTVSSQRRRSEFSPLLSYTAGMVFFLIESPPELFWRERVPRRAGCSSQGSLKDGQGEGMENLKNKTTLRHLKMHGDFTLQFNTSKFRFSPLICN